MVAPGGNLGRVSRSAFYGEPSDGPISNDNETLQAELEHDLNEVWTLRLASHYKQGRMDGYATEAAAVAADGRTLSRNLRYRDYDWQDAITQLELHGRVDTGSIEHQLLIGTEYERYALSEFMLRSDNLRSIDLYNPVYGSPRPAFNPARTVDRNELVHNRALNLQDQMRLTDKLFGVVGPVTTITSSAWTTR